MKFNESAMTFFYWLPSEVIYFPQIGCCCWCFCVFQEKFNLLYGFSKIELSENQIFLPFDLKNKVGDYQKPENHLKITEKYKINRY